MTTPQILARVDRLIIALRELTEHQIDLIEAVVAQFRKPFLNIARHPQSDIVDEQLLHDFGDVLRMHHSISKEALSKDRFEYALEKTLQIGGRAASLATSRTNLGHDITIAGVPCSLKTQADKGIREDELYISKFMELGKGHWPATAQGLGKLRDMFVQHMQAYERIFMLRCLSRDPVRWRYELVEIPKALLLDAEHGKLEIRRDTKQETRPGYCHVRDERGTLKFQLYFDAGSERKLQVKHLRKDLCMVHAQWEFGTA
jgi:type II restriction enzyme